jgi:hypothetical protein
MNAALPIWVTSVVDCLDHAVTLTAMESARTTGRPVASCGADLIPAALSAPPGRGCPSCVKLPAQRQPDHRRGGRHARPNLWRRFRDRTRHS